MQQLQGGFEWFMDHNSSLELSKLALMNFPYSHRDPIPADLCLQIQGLSAKPTIQEVTVNAYKYLRVTFDSKLHWAPHMCKVAAKATWWTLQVVRLSRISGSMPPHRICQLYNTVAIMAFTYAADVWYARTSTIPKVICKTGSVASASKIASA